MHLLNTHTLCSTQKQADNKHIKTHKNNKMSLSYRDKANITTELSVQNMTMQDT